MSSMCFLYGQRSAFGLRQPFEELRTRDFPRPEERRGAGDHLGVQNAYATTPQDFRRADQRELRGASDNMIHRLA